MKSTITLLDPDVDQLTFQRLLSKEAARNSWHIQIPPPSTPHTQLKKIICASTILSLSPFFYKTFKTFIETGCPYLKFICFNTTGIEYVDQVPLKKRRLVCSFAPNYATESVAEHTLALLLACQRPICAWQQAARLRLVPVFQKLIYRFKQKPAQAGAEISAENLKGKTLGLIGPGNIGKRVAQIAYHGFQMKILGYSRSPKSLPAYINPAKLAELVKKSDVLSFHIPYTQESHHLLSATLMRNLKKDVVIINTSRSGIIDENALFAFLRKHPQARAGLDVYDETLVKKQKAYLLSNLILTPHRTWQSLETLEKKTIVVTQNIKAFLKGKPQHVFLS